MTWQQAGWLSSGAPQRVLPAVTVGEIDRVPRGAAVAFLMMSMVFRNLSAAGSGIFGILHHQIG